MMHTALMALCVWIMHGIVNASLDQLKLREQFIANELPDSYSKDTSEHAESLTSISNLPLGNPAAATATHGRYPNFTIDPHKWRAKLQESKRGMHALCPAVCTSTTSEAALLHESVFTIPVPKICDYLRHKIAQPGERPLNDCLDCPSPGDVEWDTNPPPEHTSLYYAVSGRLRTKIMPREGALAVYIQCYVGAQTKYINSMRARKRAGETIPASDDELQRLNKRAGLEPCRSTISKELRLCFGVQLLIAGLYSRITKDIADALYMLSEEDAALLVCYMLSPEHADRFPTFVSALYFFLCQGDPSPKNVKAKAGLVFENWVCAIAAFSPTVRKASFHTAAKVATLCTMGDGAAWHAAGSSSQECQEYVGRLSVKWHAVFAAVAFAAILPEQSSPLDKLGETTTVIMELVPCSAGYSAPKSYWNPLLSALSIVLPMADFCTLIIAQTPPALASAVLQNAVNKTQIRVLIAAFWLALETPHMPGVLEDMPGLLESYNYACLYYLLVRLPIKTLAQLSSVNIDRILPRLLPQERSGTRPRWAICTGDLDNNDDRANSNGQNYRNGRENGYSDSSSNAQPQPPGSSVPKTVSCATNTTGDASTNKKLVRSEERLPGSTQNGFAPAVLCRLVLLRRSATDIADEIISYLFSDPKITRSLSRVINEMATEQPVQGRLSQIVRQTCYSDEMRSRLLEIFGNPDGADKATPYEAIPPLGRRWRHQKEPFDISWPIYANGKAYLQNLSPTFFCQIFPRLAEYVCSSMYAYGYRGHISAITHLLSVGWLQAWMPVLEDAVARMCMGVQKDALYLQRIVAGAQLFAGNVASHHASTSSAAEAYYLVHKGRPDVAIPLALAEQGLQALLPASPITVRAYVAIAASLEQLAVSVLGNTNYYAKKTTHPESTQLLLEGILRLSTHQQLFAVVPAAEVNIARDNTGTPRWAQPPLAQCRVPEYATMFKKAMCTVCYYYILALTNYLNSETLEYSGDISAWSNIFLWLYSHPLAQYHVDRVNIRLLDQCKISLAYAEHRIANILARNRRDMMYGKKGPRSDIIFLRQYLKELCSALEGSEAAYKINLDLVTKLGKITCVQAAPTQSADNYSLKRARKCQSDVENALTAV